MVPRKTDDKKYSWWLKKQKNKNNSICIVKFWYLQFMISKYFFTSTNSTVTDSNKIERSMPTRSINFLILSYLLYLLYFKLSQRGDLTQGCFFLLFLWIYFALFVFFVDILFYTQHFVFFGEHHSFLALFFVCNVFHTDLHFILYIFSDFCFQASPALLHCGLQKLKLHSKFITSSLLGIWIFKFFKS